MKYLFGPVPSRRLGYSLGIDIVPAKTCTLNCVYCQLGPTPEVTLKRAPYLKTETLLAELSEFLKQPHRVDYLTFSGSGEPTLNSVGYSNPEVDRLLEAAAEAATFEQQKPLFDRVQELIVFDQPYAFLAETERLVGVSSRVRGAVFNDASPYFNLEEWHVNVARQD